MSLTDLANPVNLAALQRLWMIHLEALNPIFNSFRLNLRIQPQVMNDRRRSDSPGPVCCPIAARAPAGLRLLAV
jgi:hypothetical protein